MSYQKLIYPFGIAGVTATTTSAAIRLEGVKKLSLQVTRSNHSSGTSTFTVTVSNDGTNYVAYSKLISNVTNTNAQTITRVASVALASDTSSVIEFDDSFLYAFMKVVATEATDGTHNAALILDMEDNDS